MSTESIHQQEQDNSESVVSKPMDALYCSSETPSFCASQTEPNSLNHLMSNRSALKGVHSALFDASRQQQKTVNFMEYGYGFQEKDAESEPPSKRRRFQRRNSKTSAMLMAMSASLLQIDLMNEEEDKCRERKTQKDSTTAVSSSDDEDTWDGGLEIAEELVKHLQQRRANIL
jgi:hypothetical protein